MDPQGATESPEASPGTVTTVWHTVKGAAGGDNGGWRMATQLVGNPMMTRPMKRDFLSPGVPAVESTTFAPPPSSFPRSLYVPSAPTGKTRHAPSTAGQFKMSARGTRRTLRSMMGSSKGQGGRTEEVLKLMEDEIRSWLMQSGAIPESYYHSSVEGRVLDSTPVEDWVMEQLETVTHGSEATSSPTAPPPTLTELTRSPSTLVWLIPSPHARFLLHVLARYYALQSFSRPMSPLQPNVRITHISRPHMVQPRMSSVDPGFETPPGTDWSDIGATTGQETSESEMAPSESELTPSEFASDADSIGGRDDEDGWQDVRDDGVLARGRRQGPAGRVAFVSTLEDVPSSDAASDTGRGESDEFDSDANVHDLVDSIADLRTDESTPVDVTPVARKTAPLPFADVTSPSGATTPQPLRSRLPRASFPPSARTRPARADSIDSSRSRSPVRVVNAVDDRLLRTTGNAVGWKLPEQTFLDYLFA
ncbi:hypothetical protein OIV83_005286 [Microbotryomycetes sp. JL201]|nr:hypothetical protein OIV83_005286 [Microbotryomycetes sp. JL201]